MGIVLTTSIVARIPHTSREKFPVRSMFKCPHCKRATVTEYMHRENSLHDVDTDRWYFECDVCHWEKAKDRATNEPK